MKTEIEKRLNLLREKHEKCVRENAHIEANDLSERISELQYLLTLPKEEPSKKRVTDEEIERMAEDYVKSRSDLYSGEATYLSIGFSAGFKKALSLPSEGKEWISVEDFLPGKSGWYEAKGLAGGIGKVPYSKTAGGNFTWVLPDASIITHWKKNSTKNI